VLPPHTIGEIVVFKAGQWFPTKDRGWTDEEGYYYHGGRADDVIISAGWTMGVKEIEDTLLKHYAVDEVAVIGVPDAVLGQAVKAYVTLKPGVQLSEREVIRHCLARLESFMVPKVVEFVDDLPKTDTGKIKKTGLA
jgi:acetyl-CoA synthetase